ncbi:HEAT repeat domain-containing protein [Salinibacter grassmerensis]|uniref:HEAT repeat domain-containing protein n=1 Tax=Salinibacter grassmerensis TaxID=3040353 RepID=UPI0021E99711|nr:HEAT repeat domain-containing protein [Salinibacter grassmerensis]
MSVDHSNCSFRRLRDGWEEDAKGGFGRLKALDSWCQEKMFGDRLVEACRAHIRDRRWCKHGKQLIKPWDKLIETWDKDDKENTLQKLPNLPGTSKHQLFMVWAHLRITKARCKGEGDLDGVLEIISGDVSEGLWKEGPPFGSSFFRALARFLNPAQSLAKNRSVESSGSADASALFPLVLDGSDPEVRVAEVHVQDSGRGDGEVLLHPEQAFLRMEDDFRSAFDSAQRLVEDLRPCLTSDVYVRIKPQGGGEWEKVNILSGKSVGGALHLSLKSLVTEGRRPEEIAISFALDSEGDSTLGKCYPVGRLQKKAEGLFGKVDRFLISEKQEKEIEEQTGLEILSARTLEDAWGHATNRLAELRRYLKHVEEKADETIEYMDQEMSRVRVQARIKSFSKEAAEEPAPHEDDGGLDPGDIVFKSELERGVVLGNPGMGKTWLLRGEARALAKKERGHLDETPQLDEVRIPIFLELVDVAELVAEESCSLREAVIRQFSNKEISPLGENDSSGRPPSESLVDLVREGIGKDRVWIFLDALDEVSHRQRSDIEDEVADFMRTNPNSRLLLTSRTTPYDDALSHVINQNRTERELELQPFGRDQVKKFTERYFQGSRTEEFLSELDNTYCLQGMTEVPLLLSFLCGIYEEGSSGFQSSANACEEILVEMLRRKGLDSSERLNRLNELSAMAFSLRAQEKLEFTQTSLRDAIAFGYRRLNPKAPDKEKIKTIQREYVSKIGLLYRSTSKSNGSPRRNKTYKFIHKNLYEYLSSRWVTYLMEEENKKFSSKIDYKKIEYENEHTYKVSDYVNLASSNQAQAIFLAETLENTDPLLELLTDQMEDGEEGVRAAVARALGEIKIPDPEVVCSLVRKTDDEEESVQEAAFESLKAIRKTEPEVVEKTLTEQLSERGFSAGILVDLLTDRCEDLRLEAAKELGRVATHTQEDVTRALVNRLGDQSLDVRKAAAWGLVKIAAPTPEVVENFANHLEREGSDAEEAARLVLKGAEAHYRENSGDVAGASGDKNVSAQKTNRENSAETELINTQVISLAEWLEKGECSAMEIAEWALKELDTEREKLLIEQLTDQENANVRAAAARALKRLESFDPGVQGDLVPRLEARLEDENTDVQRAASRTLGKSKVSHPSAVKILTGWLEDEKANTREAAARALVKSGTEGRKVLAGELADKPAGVREAVVRVLGETEDSDPRTEAVIARRIGDKNTEVRKAAAQALGKTGISHTKALKFLISRLRDESEGVREAVARALGKIAISDSRAMETKVCNSKAAEFLANCVEAENVELQKAGAKALLKGGEVERLVGVLADKGSDTKEVTTHAFEEAGHDTVEALVECLGAEDAMVRRTAAQALGETGASNSETVMALTDRLGDKDRKVRRISAQVLQQLKDLNTRAMKKGISDLLDKKDTNA